MAKFVKHADELTLFLLAEAIRRFDVEPGFADKILQRLFAEKKGLKDGDRWSVSEMFYDFLRNKRLLESGMDFKGYKPIERAYMLSAAYFVWRGISVPKRLDLPRFNVDGFLKRVESSAATNPAIAHSVPDWLFNLGTEELGEAWVKELEALNYPPLQALRVNTMKISPEELKGRLESHGFECSIATDVGSGIVMGRKVNLFTTAEFHEGLFELQDISSQRVAELLAPKPGMTVLDACAGNGGKTLHIADLMKNRGRLIATDTMKWKLDTLKHRAKRAGVFIVEARQTTDANSLTKLNMKVDRLLLDVPCSGTGVWRRNPEARWLMQENALENLHRQQQEILRTYSALVKKGGQMVYSTCSILPSENHKQVEAFLIENPSFKMEKQLQLLPSQTDGDGFYMALLTRVG